MNVISLRDFAAARKAAARAPATERPTPQPAATPAACGSGWYHEEAIRASQPKPEHRH